MEQVTLQVRGMSCNHCVNAIEGNVGELPGVSSVTVNLAEGTVQVGYEPGTITLDTIKEVIDDQGYDVE